jgi:hypothetical protein
MEANQIIEEITAELLRAEDILNTHFRNDLAEPFYKKCLQLIGENPSLKQRIVSVFLELFTAHRISHEPLAYLMHVLRWPEIRASLESTCRQFSNPIVEAVDISKVLAAYDDNWEDREFYTF